jgi:hypothetical protein
MSRGSKLFTVSFFALYLVVGLLAFDDYGVSWDEGHNRRNGQISARYVTGQVAQVLGIRSPTELETQIHTYPDRDYGVFVELPLYALETTLGLDDSRDRHHARHLATFLIFWGASIAFFFLAKNRFGRWWIALIGCALLIASPRIFAHSFFNSKDIGFLSVLIVAVYTLQRLRSDPSVLNVALHAVASAAAVSTRIVGVLIPAITLVVIGLDFASRTLSPTRPRRVGVITLAYLAALVLLTTAFWPYLWSDPIGNFAEAFRNMSRFRWESTVLYRGEFMLSSELPWHYVPVWIGVTTPILYLALFFVGAGSLLNAVWTSKARTWSERGNSEDLIYVTLLLVPIASAILLRSVLYDGWRHMYFVYPAFLMIALRGVSVCARTVRREPGPSGGPDPSLGPGPSRGRMALGITAGAIMGVSILGTVRWMVVNHPHQHVYFNALAGEGNILSDDGHPFELDYWGLSYREGLEYLLERDGSGVIAVSTANMPGDLSGQILAPEDRNRLRFVELEDATYLLSNFRFLREYRPYVLKEFPYTNEVWALEVGGRKILGVYALE